MNTISRALLIILFAAVVVTGQSRANDKGWPRKFTVAGASVAVYQPQIEEWSGNSFSGRYRSR